MEKKIKIALRVLVISAVVLFWARGIYLPLSGSTGKEFCDCGIIQSKGSDEAHGTRTDLYLNIIFEKQGFKAKEVGPTTYFKHKIGDKVCFDFPIPDSTWDMVNIVLSISLSIVAGIGLLGAGLVYIFD